MTAVHTGETTPVSLLQLARQTQCMRARIARLFPRDVFRDSAWDMMLELFVAAEEDRAVCVKQIILVSGESSTSALRRIDRLEESGLLRRSHDPTDHRRVSVVLTPKGTDAMAAMLCNLYLADQTQADQPAKPVSFHPQGLAAAHGDRGHSLETGEEK